MYNPYLKFLYKPEARQKLKNNIGDFAHFDADYCSKLLISKEPEFWQKAGEKMALTLFRAAAYRVPAYKDFLKRNKINPVKIKTIADFSKLPIIDKKNYLQNYPVEKLCWDGKVEKNTLLAVSSGSSGVPFFWPRGDNLELETSIYHELFLRDIFGADRHSTLFIITFSMGIYIAGIITLNSVLRAAQKSYPLTVITPGINADDTLRVIKEMGQKYEQIILAGYPPFVKDILEQGEREKINWNNFRMKFLFATEGFSETWRDYALQKAGSKNILKDSLNIYGSADAGILGHETPICIFLRREMPDLFQRNNRLPTLTQYNPLLKYFEEINGEAIFSCYGGIPFVRYNIHDTGGVLNFGEIAKIPPQKAFNDKIWKLPFLYVFSKSDNTSSLYGVNIYPENIKTALEQAQFNKMVTGKFVMTARNKPNNHDQYLEINIELAEACAASKKLLDKIRRVIIRNLQKSNLEYGRLRQSIGAKADPKIILWPQNHAKYFNPQAIKQKWSLNP
ncbi:MAG: phenylacetate--CoA ligase family protein [Candidatus Nealsonbacteria bacterium]|nr:phenylacetate--CoA ligase family protein [Candidatus Nealsonbacteria bacterium]